MGIPIQTNSLDAPTRDAEMTGKDREIDSLKAELSYVRFLLCEALEGHNWELQEMDDFWEMSWEKCRQCGASRGVKPTLRLVSND